MVRKIRYGEKWAGLSALALLGFMFLDWFGTLEGVYLNRAQGAPAGVISTVGASGWDTLGWLAIGLIVLAIVAGVALPVVFATHESPVLPVLAGIMAVLLGGLAAIAILVQGIWQPGPDELVQLRSGWWLGLLASLGVARGGFLSMRDEYLPGVPLPDVPVRPAPPATAA